MDDKARQLDDLISRLNVLADTHAAILKTATVPATVPRNPPSLTPRELEALRCLALGMTNPEISRELYLSLGTVKTYVEHIFLALGASNRTQAAMTASALGMLVASAAAPGRKKGQSP